MHKYLLNYSHNFYKLCCPVLGKRALLKAKVLALMYSIIAKTNYLSAWRQWYTYALNRSLLPPHFCNGVQDGITFQVYSWQLICKINGLGSTEDFYTYVVMLILFKVYSEEDFLPTRTIVWQVHLQSFTCSYSCTNTCNDILQSLLMMLQFS